MLNFPSYGVSANPLGSSILETPLVSPDFSSSWGLSDRMPQGTPVGIPGTGAVGAGQFGGLGLNMDTARLGLAGLGTVGNLWAAFQAQNLARQQFNYTKGVTDTNINNQIRNYNTGLEDRARSRGFVEGQSQSSINDYVNKNRLTRSGV